MTALCSGGSSAANAGLGDQITLTTSALEALLNAVPVRWAVPFAAVLGLVTEHLSTFCTIDPPGYPTFTAQDFVDLINPLNFSAHLAASRKFRDFIDTVLWYQSCHCVSVATPSPPAAPSAPTGMPTVNPPGVGTEFPVGEPCGTWRVGMTTPPSTNEVAGPYPIDGITFMNAVWAANVTTTTSSGAQGGVLFYNAANTILGSFGVGVNTGGTTATGSLAVPAGTDHFTIAYGGIGVVTPAVEFTIDVAGYCGTSTPGGGSGVVPVPCQMDPSIQIMLGQILALVTLIQRNGVPFAYVPGAAHSGLSGNGTLTIPTCIGLQIDLTTTPGWIGEESGSPPELFESGWFSWGTPDGFIGREFITHDPQLSFPPKAEQYTRIGYSLASGVVATITELYAET